MELFDASQTNWESERQDDLRASEKVNEITRERCDTMPPSSKKGKKWRKSENAALVRGVQAEGISRQRTPGKKQIDWIRFSSLHVPFRSPDQCRARFQKVERGYDKMVAQQSSAHDTDDSESDEGCPEFMKQLMELWLVSAIDIVDQLGGIGIGMDDVSEATSASDYDRTDSLIIPSENGCDVLLEDLNIHHDLPEAFYAELFGL